VFLYAPAGINVENHFVVFINKRKMKHSNRTSFLIFGKKSIGETAQLRLVSHIGRMQHSNCQTVKGLIFLSFNVGKIVKKRG
jgi:hypothetical protein